LLHPTTTTATTQQKQFPFSPATTVASMLVHHASPLTSSRDNITKVRHSDEDSRKVHLLHDGQQQAQQYTTNEQGEHEEKKMSVNCLLNNPVDEIRTSSSSILRNSKGIRCCKYYATVST
jgi:hypothetical protein